MADKNDRRATCAIWRRVFESEEESPSWNRLGAFCDIDESCTKKKDEDVTAANIRTGCRGDEIAVVRIRRLLTSITGDYETGVGSLLGSFCQDFDGINWLALVLSRIQE